jgi:hypothetical protein
LDKRKAKANSAIAQMACVIVLSINTASSDEMASRQMKEGN